MWGKGGGGVGGMWLLGEVCVGGVRVLWCVLVVLVLEVMMLVMVVLVVVLLLLLLLLLLLVVVVVVVVRVGIMALLVQIVAPSGACGSRCVWGALRSWWLLHICHMLLCRCVVRRIQKGPKACTTWICLCHNKKRNIYHADIAANSHINQLNGATVAPNVFD